MARNEEMGNNDFLDTVSNSSTRIIPSNGQNFPLVARRSMRDFIDHDEQDGFFLNR